METLTFAGSYEDGVGREDITWRIEGSRRYKFPSLDFYTSIRGVDVWGTDFDGLEPVDASAAVGRLPLNSAGELSRCVISGDLPCTVMVADHRQSASITFTLDLRQPAAPGEAAQMPAQVSPGEAQVRLPRRGCLGEVLSAD